MRLQITFVFLLMMMGMQVFGQYTSRDNQTGYWNDGGTWDGSIPPNTVTSTNVIIEGFVKWDPPSQTELTFDIGGNPNGPASEALIVRDTLIVYGNIYFENQNNLIIEEGGILIVYGDLGATNKIEIDPQGYLIVEGDLNLSPSPQDEVTNDGDNMFVGGDYGNCNDCNQTEPDTALDDEDENLDDLYEGEDPDNEGQYNVYPQSTDICGRSPQQVTLYFSDDDNDNVDDFYWQKSNDGTNFTAITGTNGEGSLTITSTQTRYYRVWYSTDNGSSYTASDQAVVYCNNLCTMTTTVSLSSGPASGCYTEGMSYEFSSSESDGTAPYTWSWSISPSTNSQGDAIGKTENANQVTFVNFTNPLSVSQDYTVTVEVTDNEGCSDTGSQTVTLQRLPETGNTYHVPNDFDDK